MDVRPLQPRGVGRPPAPVRDVLCVSATGAVCHLSLLSLFSPFLPQNWACHSRPQIISLASDATHWQLLLFPALVLSTLRLRLRVFSLGHCTFTPLRSEVSVTEVKLVFYSNSIIMADIYLELWGENIFVHVRDIDIDFWIVVSIVLYNLKLKCLLIFTLRIIFPM